jgi:anthranilate phosphoribosyltransferase
MKKVLNCERNPYRDVVLLNAAAALVAAGIAADWDDGLGRAAESIDSGKAGNKLDSLIRLSQASD